MEKPNFAGDKFQRENLRLTLLMNSDPAAAITAARALHGGDAKWTLLRAVILCDAGIAVKDVAAVEEAISIFSRLHERLPEKGGLAYNLANAFIGRADLDRTQAPEWYLQTVDLRHRARALYGQAAFALEKDDPALASQVLTNLGNALDKAHRWIEAYECYQAALRVYPENGVASGCAAEVLFRVSSHGIVGHRPHLIDVALRLAHHAQVNRDTVVRFSGPQAAESFDRLDSSMGERATPDIGEKASPYERFVAENRLLLSPVLEGLGHDRRRWDDAHITEVSQPVSNGACTPPIFAMFNLMKADYLVARKLLFLGLDPAGEPLDTGLYFDTLDYAVYGIRPSQLVLAQRAALDLLDKIAVALNEHFGTGENPKHVTFQAFWREKSKEVRWKSTLAKMIQTATPRWSHCPKLLRTSRRDCGKKCPCRVSLTPRSVCATREPIVFS